MLCQIRDGQCPEYSGEDQAICAVGLAKCRAGVFVEAIQYLLVLATPVEVKLFCFFHSLVLCICLSFFSEGESNALLSVGSCWNLLH